MSCEGGSLTETASVMDNQKRGEVMRKFLIESNLDGGGIFTGPTETKVWTLEEMIREINRDRDCTDDDGDVYINSKTNGDWVMAGSLGDTTDHEGTGCFVPYDEQDWETGWDIFIEQWHRIINEVK